MKYHFNLKLQVIYGVVGFGMALGLLYLFLGMLDWTGSAIVGAVNFAISGFYATKTGE
jgi:hypothetical protein